MHGAIQIGANRLVAVMESDNRLGDGALIKRSRLLVRIQLIPRCRFATE